MANSKQNNLARDSAIAALAKENQLLIITDLNHYDDSVHQFTADQLDTVSCAGVKHLYIEQDPEDFSKDHAHLLDLTRNMSPSELLAFETSKNNPYNDQPDAKLYIEAKRLGIEIHPFDDRSQIKPINLMYGEESKLMYENPSADDADLIKFSPNPEKMAKYLDEFNAVAIDSQFRNERMLENITSDMSKHP